MSTKIYNGYYLENMDLLQLHKFIMEFRKRVEKKEKELFAKLKAKKITTLIDNLIFECEDKAEYEELMKKTLKDFSFSDVPYWIIEQYINEKQREVKHTQRRNPSYDFDCEIVFIPIENKILAMFYTERKEYLNMWNNTKGVRQYNYWNNTDKPQHISYKKWEERGKEWDEALGKSGIPALSGFTVQCHSPYIHVTLNEVMEHMPSLEKRVNTIAMNLVFKEKSKELRGEKDVNETNGIWKVISDTERWLRTEEGKAAVEKKKEFVELKIIKQITKQMMIEPLEKLLEG